MSPDTARRRWVAVTAQRERLLRIARARTLNEQDAEDCVQEAMLRCVEFANLDEARLEAFLTTVTVRLCADTHRFRTQRDRAGHRLAGVLHDPSPEDAVCDQAEAVWVAGRIDELPPRQQEIVRARASGLSHADTARRYELSHDAVESLLARARRTLRAAYTTTYGWAALRVRRLHTTAPAAGMSVAAAVMTATVVAGISLHILPPGPNDPDAPPRPLPSAERVALLTPTPYPPLGTAAGTSSRGQGHGKHDPSSTPLVPPVTLSASPGTHEPRPLDEYLLDCVRYGPGTIGPHEATVYCQYSPTPTR